MLQIRQVSSKEDALAAAKLVRDLTAWAIALDPATANAPTFDGLEEELAMLPGKYAPPTGCFLLAYEGRTAIGCVAFARHSETVVEVKRMYVDPAQRGKGVGQKLVATLIKEARTRGAKRIILDSYYKMFSAHKIYRGLGFKDVPAPNDYPASLVDKVVFMELDLVKADRGSPPDLTPHSGIPKDG